MSTGWALLCEQTNTSIQNDVALLVIITIVFVAVAVLVVLKLITNQSSLSTITGFVAAFFIISIIMVIGTNILGNSISNCSSLPGASTIPTVLTQDYGPLTEFSLTSADNDNQFSNLNQNNPDGWTLFDHNPDVIPFSGNLMTIVAHVTFNNMTIQENVNIFIDGLDVAQPIQIPAGGTGDFSDGTCFHLDSGDEVKLHATGSALDPTNTIINLKVTSVLTSADCP